MRRLSREQGFTLIELVMVIAMIALLTAMAAPRMHAAIVRSRVAQVEKDLQGIQSALDRHYLDHSFYPIKLNDLVTRGYLRPTSFRSSLSGHRFFYAVDDNREDGFAHAYALGAPPRNAYKEEYRTLYRENREIPEGRNPTLKARAWLRWEIKPGDVDWLRLLLKYENDATTIENQEDLPDSLSQYRFSCRPTSSTPCNLLTN
jgi:prepilin-type N-terminal cleavage/methylation domain-containing protein